MILFKSRLLNRLRIPGPIGVSFPSAIHLSSVLGVMPRICAAFRRLTLIGLLVPERFNADCHAAERQAVGSPKALNGNPGVANLSVGGARRPESHRAPSLNFPPFWKNGPISSFRTGLAAVYTLGKSPRKPALSQPKSAMTERVWTVPGDRLPFPRDLSGW
jgi:hypothetical protein